MAWVGSILGDLRSVTVERRRSLAARARSIEHTVRIQIKMCRSAILWGIVGALSVSAWGASAVVQRMLGAPQRVYVVQNVEGFPPNVEDQRICEERLYAGSLFPLGLDQRKWVIVPIYAHASSLDDICVCIEGKALTYKFTLHDLHPCDGTRSISGGKLAVTATERSVDDSTSYSGEIPFKYLGAPGDESSKIFKTTNPIPCELVAQWQADQALTGNRTAYSVEEVIQGKDELRDLLSRIYQGDKRARRTLIVSLMNFYARRFAPNPPSH